MVEALLRKHAVRACQNFVSQNKKQWFFNCRWQNPSLASFRKCLGQPLISEGRETSRSVNLTARFSPMAKTSFSSVWSPSLLKKYTIHCASSSDDKSADASNLDASDEDEFEFEELEEADFEDEMDWDEDDNFEGPPAHWLEEAREQAEIILKENVNFGPDFEIFALQVNPRTSLIRIKLDKLSDRYGSPTLDEISTFTREYQNLVEKSKGIPSDFSIEVSSPGAERQLRIPRDLLRFQELPIQVQYRDSESGLKDKKVLELVEVDESGKSTLWKLANVKVNRESTGKGRGMNKKQREWRLSLPFSHLESVSLYLDF